MRETTSSPLLPFDEVSEGESTGRGAGGVLDEEGNGEDRNAEQTAAGRDEREEE